MTADLMDVVRVQSTPVSPPYPSPSSPNVSPGMVIEDLELTGRGTPVMRAASVWTSTDMWNRGGNIPSRRIKLFGHEYDIYFNKYALIEYARK